jgi:hypothetical protein
MLRVLKGSVMLRVNGQALWCAYGLYLAARQQQVRKP